ncbi:RNA-dependent ATPase rok1 [Arthroderma sp. PD_2]|nr:RNA-dependent ATPase rok1 [Arthroderma sp. PD_2]
MDAFKLLTRSTKLKPSAANAKRSAANRLPSTGDASTPQLFPTRGRHSREKQSDDNIRGKKRKRGSKDGGDAATTDSGLNFFTGLSSVPEVASKIPEDEDAGADRDDDEDNDSARLTAQPSSLPEAERKVILKSHKIKVTDLRTPKPNSDDTEGTKKKSKKRKREKEPVAALTKKQRKALQALYPDPLVSFDLLQSKYKISRRVVENIRNQGYTVPTEVQLGCLPMLLGSPSESAENGNKNDSKQPNEESEPDLLTIAPTGSGKTLAFMIPLINKIMKHRHQGASPQSKGTLAIVVAPTKELASQIANEGRKLAFGTGIKITTMRKGMRVVEGSGGDDTKQEEVTDEDESNASSDEELPKRRSKTLATVTKSDILVTTPLQLVNNLVDNGQKELSKMPLVQSLVLDEADVLLDPLFRDQTHKIWQSCVNPQLRVGLWSATMGSNIEELAKSVIAERQQLLGLKEGSSLIRLVVGLKDSAIPSISHKLTYAATEQGKLLGLRQLLHPTTATASAGKHLRPPFIVFTQTIPRAVALHSELMYDIPPEAGGSSRIAVLHSELSDSQRSDVMTGFRKGEIWIIITTDLLSRGVDFRGINGVVNYDIPNSAAAYVHRVGRTGRAGREGGVAVTFYTKEDIPYVKNIANVIAASEKLRGSEGVEPGIQKWLLDALPDLTKNDKKDLKRYGVQARRRTAAMSNDKDRRTTRISTKSGFERRMENNRRGAIKGSQSRKLQESNVDAAQDDAWSGFED